MNRKKSKNFVLGCVILTLLFTGVYALLATTLNITGNATGQGDFKVEFMNANSSNDDKATAVINSDKTNITITANLSYPGDSVTVDFTIQNTGTLSATVNDLLINNDSNDDLKVLINDINDIEGTHLQGGETKTGSIVISWDDQSANANPEPVSFDITIDYIQTT